MSGWNSRPTTRRPDSLRGAASGDNGHRRRGQGRVLLPSYQIDGEGNPIDKRNAWQTRSVLYVHLIPPGAADTVHLPRRPWRNDAEGPITLRSQAELPQIRRATYTQFTFAGAAKPGYRLALSIAANIHSIRKPVPDLPIVTAGQAAATIDSASRLEADRPKKDASAGTIGALACSCRAILKAPSTPFVAYRSQAGLCRRLAERRRALWYRKGN